MKVKPIYIFFLIISLLSVSLVVAAEVDGNLHSDNEDNGLTHSEMLVPSHHNIRHHHDMGNNAAKNNFTIDTYVLSQIND